MSQYKTDAQWADACGLPLSIFLGERSFTPDVDWASLPCGQDDFVGDVIDAQREMIELRKAWGEDSEDMDFGDYLRKYAEY